MTDSVNIIFGLPCSTVSIDRETNAVSLFNVLEDMQFTATVKEATDIIAIPYQFDFIALFGRDDTSKTAEDLPFTAKLSLLSPDGKELMDIPIESKIEKGKKKLRIMIKSDGIKLTRTGTYIFKVDLFDRTSNSIVQTIRTPIDISVQLTINKQK